MEDRQLVHKVLSGDTAAFELLIARYQKLVSHMIYRLIDDERDREELAQDIFVKIYYKLSGFGFQSKLSTWIATIAYREAANHLKKNKKWKNEEQLDDIQSNKSGEWDLRSEQEDYAAYIQQWIQKLPHSYRTILTLYHLEEMSYPEIVEVMQMPEGTVKNYLFRARKKLKELLAPQLNKEIFIHE
jgi:RNA polymerase sigma factor (sigma-70 family)